jgi:hypothetical protein
MLLLLRPGMILVLKLQNTGLSNVFYQFIKIKSSPPLPFSHQRYNCRVSFRILVRLKVIYSFPESFPRGENLVWTLSKPWRKFDGKLYLGSAT